MLSVVGSSLCDEKTHPKKKGKSCWEMLKKEWPQLKHPNPDWKGGRAPKPKVTVKDN